MNGEQANMSLFIDWQLASLCAQAAAFPELKSWADQLPGLVDAQLNAQRCGEFHVWQQALQSLKFNSVSHCDLTTDALCIGQPSDLTHEQHSNLPTQLMAFHPWRKGPFDVFGHHLDCEWRSDWKWQRLAPHIADLKDKLVLDVGCGNGYFGWRMVGAGARLVIGIDPTPLFNWQWQLMRQLIRLADKHPLHSPHASRSSHASRSPDRNLVLPFTLEQLPPKLQAFDHVFSMGVLYHRRSPLDHLQQLQQALKPGGELVLETLIIDGAAGMSLLPQGRYAQMRNVWFIPTIATLQQWLARIGFKNIRCVDVTTTSPDEQRHTAWMPFKSLADFLNPEDNRQTLEGHPAPKRAILLANRE